MRRVSDVDLQLRRLEVGYPAFEQKRNLDTLDLLEPEREGPEDLIRDLRAGVSDGARV